MYANDILDNAGLAGVPLRSFFTEPNPSLYELFGLHG